jgi:hypothetical protein
MIMWKRGMLPALVAQWCASFCFVQQAMVKHRTSPCLRRASTGGAGYKEIAPGVFRSADGLRQFRMTDADILGSHGNIGSHVRFEALNEFGQVIENLHLPVTR